jgi:hypothetical protein
MKKLIAAAVATSVSAFAIADVSITGSLKTNFTHTDAAAATANDNDTFSTEGNLSIKGKSGDTSVVMNFGNIDATSAGINQAAVQAEDVYLTTKIGDVHVKMGDYDNCDHQIRASTRTQRANLTTELGGFTLSYLNGTGLGNTAHTGTTSVTQTEDVQDDEVAVSTNFGGIGVKYAKKDSADQTKVTGSMQGINVVYDHLGSDSANSDRSMIEVSTELSGVGIKFGQLTADASATISGDSWMGDYEGTKELDITTAQDVTAIELKTAMAGNTVAFRSIKVDGVASEDIDMNKIILTRPLASGATLEVTYKDIDDAGTTSNNAEVFDVALAVKF